MLRSVGKHVLTYLRHQVSDRQSRFQFLAIRFAISWHRASPTECREIESVSSTGRAKRRNVTKPAATSAAAAAAARRNNYCLFDLGRRDLTASPDAFRGATGTDLHYSAWRCQYTRQTFPVPHLISIRTILPLTDALPMGDRSFDKALVRWAFPPLPRPSAAGRCTRVGARLH